VPIIKSALPGGDPALDFNPLRLFGSTSVESDKSFFTSVIFEDVNIKDLNADILSNIDNSIFNISTGLYPFIVFDYFTASFNVIYPTPAELEAALSVFEPIFLRILNRYNPPHNPIDFKGLPDVFRDFIVTADDSMELTRAFLDCAAEYFRRFNLYRDDDLALKGWWRINHAER
jgi:hypothetical protein